MVFEFDKGTIVQLIILVICVFGLLGNFLCAVVIIRKLLKSPFYLLLLGLTFSDSLLLLMSFIRTSNHLEILNLNTTPKYVEIINFLLDWISTSGTKYFTVAVAMERYFVICHPIRAQRIVTPDRAVYFLLGVFSFVFLLSAWSYVYFYHIDKRSFNAYTAIVLHFLPFLLVLGFTVLLYIGLRKYQAQRTQLTAGESKEVSVTKMLLAVVFVFGFCYSFEFIRRFMAYADYFDFSKYKWHDYIINCLADIFFVLNSAINFIVYCLTGGTFYRTFLEVLDPLFPSKWAVCLRFKSKQESPNNSTQTNSTQ